MICYERNEDSHRQVPTWEHGPTSVFTWASGEEIPGIF